MGIINAIFIPISVFLLMMIFAEKITKAFKTISSIMLSTMPLFIVEPNKFLKTSSTSTNNELLVLYILITLIIIFLEVYNNKIKKQLFQNNKNSIFQTNYLVSKKKYISMSYFLGLFGAHRFLVNDTLTGSIYLAIIILPIIITFIIPTPGLLLFILGVSINCSLSISDRIIARSKTVDDNGMIYV